MKNKQNDIASHFDEILDAIHEELMITDGKGMVLKVSPTFETMYNISAEEALGRTVYELEDEGYFNPSIVAMVLESGNRVTSEQSVNNKRTLVVTATPVYDDKGNILYIVSFSRDITEILQLQKRYANMENKIKEYTAEINRLRKENQVIGNVVGSSPQMDKILNTIKRIADFDANFMFLGPSGVGKTMLSKIVHENSNRKDGPFVEINCAAIPESLLESELFGYEKGSFTGASSKGKIGLIELANGGTLLLDEISEMPLNLQAKLLKAIQDKEIMRIGGTKKIKVDFHLITATNRNLEEMTEQGLFRKDLYYRLNVINIEIPPLSERKEDIIPLIDYFLDNYNRKYGLQKKFRAQALKYLLDYSWPGNVRELSNIVERAFIISPEDIITEESLPKNILDKKNGEILNRAYDTQDLVKAVEEFEGDIIREAYAEYKTSMGVAEALNISQPTASRKISKYVKNK